MNILFLTSAAPRRSGFSTSEKRPPLGVGYLMAVLKREGHRIFFSDEYLSPSNILDTDFLQKEKIDYVGIYSNTICYQSTLQMFQKLQSKREKKQWLGKIMVGGPHTSVGYREIPEYVDYIVIGEGEVTVPKIINGEIKDRIVIGEKVEDLDSLPMPSWEEFIFRPYHWTHSWYPVYPLYTFNTSRGCPFSCTFCSVKAIWGKEYRYMSAERVVHDVEYMIKHYGAKGIYFREDHFTLNKNRTVEFCELLLKRNIKIDWFCETRVDQLGDYEYQKLLADAGCKVFYIGVESGSPKMLEFYKKGETREQFIKAFDIAKKVGIKTFASFVVGYPTETEEDRALTDDLISIIKPDVVGKNVFLGLPGSELYDYLKDNNLYEYKDEQNILYPRGFLKNVKKYYGSTSNFDVYHFDSNNQAVANESSQLSDNGSCCGDEGIQSVILARLKKYYTLLNQWLRLCQKTKSLTVFFKDNSLKKIAIYGMGELAQNLWGELKNTDVRIGCFVDNYNNGQMGNHNLPVLGLEKFAQSFKSDPIDAVIVTPIYDYENIVSQLRNSGYPGKIISLEEVVQYVSNCETSLED